MNLISNKDGIIKISLSRRNLVTLLKMLDGNVAQPELHRRVDDSGTILSVKAEEDNEHYISENRQAAVLGRMGDGPDVVDLLEKKNG